MACNNFLFGMELCTTLDEAVISPVAASQQQTRDNFILVSHIVDSEKRKRNHGVPASESKVCITPK